MKAIELMQKLGELVATHGDVEVKVEQDKEAAGLEPSSISMIIFTKQDYYNTYSRIVIQGAS